MFATETETNSRKNLLFQACFHRAVDATALDRNTIDEFLGKWLAVSTKIDGKVNSMAFYEVIESCSKGLSAF